MITPQQAYIKGLDDAELSVITKLTNTLNGVDDPFMNPKLEEVRQQIVTIIERPVGNIDKDRLLKVFNSVLKGKPSRLEIQDPEIEEFRQRLQKVITAVYDRTQKRSSFAVQMRKILRQNTIKELTSEEEVVN